MFDEFTMYLFLLGNKRLLFTTTTTTTYNSDSKTNISAKADLSQRPIKNDIICDKNFALTSSTLNQFLKI